MKSGEQKIKKIQDVDPEMIVTQRLDKETHREEMNREFGAILIEYITKVNSRYRGNEFTSSQLAKTVITTMKMENTRFPIIHRTVKEILRTWEKQGLCTHITRTKYSRCRKTKDTYRFNSKGLKEIKKHAIDQTIETIERRELKAEPIMRTRQSIILDRLEKLIDSIAVTPE